MWEVTLMEFYRDTWAEINLDAIKWNVKNTLKELDPSVFLYAVVKANAYGHGDIQVARTALQAGAKGLAVAFLDEALKLRAAGIQEPILVLGASRPEDARLAAEQQISLTVYDENWLQKVHIQEGPQLNVHVKCDTGMGRIGLKTKEELQQIISQINQSDSLVFEGIFTHFATADELETDYLEEQIMKFRQLIDSLSEKPPFIHCANSAATLRFKEVTGNAVRLGISMYGLTPSDEIGTLPIGYADGWIRKMSGQEVLIDGQRAPIVGRICMDQCMIRLPKEYRNGTVVTLIGRQGNEEISMEEISAKRETINYEIPCVITSRVPRVYKEEGKTASIVNPLL
jgi:alanine racemase